MDSMNFFLRWKGVDLSSYTLGRCNSLGFYNFCNRFARRVVLSLFCSPESLNISYSFCLNSIESATYDIQFK